MGKVRKLRKKFKALCQKNGAISKTSKISDSKKKLKISALPVKGNSTHFEIRSIAPVSKVNNESRITYTSKEIPTKVHQKSYHLSSGKNIFHSLSLYLIISVIVRVKNRLE